jgi:IS30 family transposase
MRKDKKTQAEIARAIGVSQATVSKELKRNICSNGHYSPKMAQVFADDAKQRSHKPRKLDADMKAFIVEKIGKFQWSPEQIKGYCDANGIEMVSVEWIYRLIRDDKRNGGTLYKHCRHRLKHRKRCVGAGVGHIPDRVSIHQRPDSVEDRKEFGHFEMDLIQNGKDFILTVTERKTRFLLMERLANGKNADGVAKTVIRLLKPFKRHVLSITTDNGGEFARHKLVSKALNAPVFFADPYSSWQKGTVENTNKLIRQYINKQMNISNITHNNLLVIQNKLNYRPRKVLAFNNPATLFYNFAC